MENPMTDTRIQSTFWHDVEKELSKPVPGKILQAIPEERAARNVSVTHPPVIQWKPAASDPRVFSMKPPEGGITLFWGHSERNTIQKLYTAYLSHDIDALDRLKDEIANEHEGRPVMSVKNAVSSLCRSPFFDFRFLEKTLAENLFLPDASVGALVFPYTGAELETDTFSIASYLRSGESLPYEVFAVINPPVLTSIERAALAAVPQTSAGMHVGGSTQIITALVTVVVFAAINTCVCGLAFQDRVDALKLSKDVLTRLRSNESLDELLKLRQSLFQEFGITN